MHLSSFNKHFNKCIQPLSVIAFYRNSTNSRAGVSPKFEPMKDCFSWGNYEPQTAASRFTRSWEMEWLTPTPENVFTSNEIKL